MSMMVVHARLPSYVFAFDLTTRTVDGRTGRQEILSTTRPTNTKNTHERNGTTNNINETFRKSNPRFKFVPKLFWSMYDTLFVCTYDQTLSSPSFVLELLSSSTERGRGLRERSKKSEHHTIFHLERFSIIPILLAPPQVL